MCHKTSERSHDAAGALFGRSRAAGFSGFDPKMVPAVCPSVVPRVKGNRSQGKPEHGHVDPACLERPRAAQERLGAAQKRPRTSQERAKSTENHGPRFEEGTGLKILKKTPYLV